MLARIFGALSPGGARARLSVLIFHRVMPRRDPLFPQELDAHRFDQICAWVKRWFHVMPLDEAVHQLRLGKLPARAMGISFDDGYADNHQVALPILNKHGLSATFFIATDYLDGGRMWNDSIIEAVRGTSLPSLAFEGPDLPREPQLTGSVAERSLTIHRLIGSVKYLEPPVRQAAVDQIATLSGATLPTDLMMTSSQVRDLRAQGMVVGAHTASHPILARISEREAYDEIVRGKARLEEIVGERISLFAYPNGKPGEDYLPRNVNDVRNAGFSAAFSTAWGAARSSSCLFELPRFTPWDDSRLAFSLRLLQNLATR